MKYYEILWNTMKYNGLLWNTMKCIENTKHVEIKWGVAWWAHATPHFISTFLEIKWGVAWLGPCPHRCYPPFYFYVWHEIASTIITQTNPHANPPTLSQSTTIFKGSWSQKKFAWMWRKAWSSSWEARWRQMRPSSTILRHGTYWYSSRDDELQNIYIYIYISIYIYIYI